MSSGLVQRGSQNVLITGCSSGIGLASAVEFAKRGHHVWATMRDIARADSLTHAARSASVELTLRPLDVRNHEMIEAVVREIEDHGGVDVLINNAGIALGGLAEDATAEDLREVIETNFIGAVNCVRAVLPGFRHRRAGRIVNVSSIAGRVGAPYLGAYTASKFALEGWSECLRYEVEPWGIDVVLVEPGTFVTNITAAAAYGGTLRRRRSRWPKLDADLERLVLEDAARGKTPEVVARRLADIVAAKRPRFRYLVGVDAKLEAALSRALPDAAAHAVAQRLIWRTMLRPIRAEARQRR
jgi:NAD(P)-dependent dehydrogenase (short-subunit alcohol dehydrogenase family)